MTHQPESEFGAFDAETLALFVEESLEGLDRVGELVLRAEAGERPPDLLATLFRDMHTIKGASGFLGFPRIRDLTHAAEELLSKLRDGVLEARPDHFAALMGVEDALRSMFESIRQSGSEGNPVLGDLIARLRGFLEEAKALQETAGEAKLGELLVQKAIISPQQLDEALQAQKHLGEILVEKAMASEGQIQEVLQQQRQVREKAKEKEGEAAEGSVRVGVGVLDRLMALMGELVLARNQVVQAVAEDQRCPQALAMACQRVDHVTSDLQVQIMKVRMQPMGRVFEKLPRMVRDLCLATGKKAACQVEGTGTEIDKALVEAIKDPILHIVRNAVDHGLETPEERQATGKSQIGQVTVRASQEGGSVVVELKDDGRGMDPAKLKAHAIRKGILSPSEAERLGDREALELIFRPGFSTAAQVTDISGRGVGMDVVRTAILKAGGEVELESALGRGSTFRLRLPLTLAILPVFLVEEAGEAYAIPQANLEELVRLSAREAARQIESLRGAEVLRLRGEVLPLVRLGRLLPGGRAQGNGAVYVVVVHTGSFRFGLAVEGIRGIEEIVVKPLPGRLKALSAYSGVTILGDGNLALILDINGVAHMAGMAPTGTPAHARAPKAEGTATGEPHLIFRAGGGEACALPLSLVGRLERIPARQIERLGKGEVVQYRGGILPLLRVEAALGLEAAPLQALQPVVVLGFRQPVGLVVGDILDVLDLAPTLEPVEEEGIAGRAVVQGRTTLFLDVYALVRKLLPRFVQEPGQDGRRGIRVLLVDDARTLRATIGAYLRREGLEVKEAGNGEEALALLNQQEGRFDVLVTDLEMGGLDGWALTRLSTQAWPRLPVLAFTHLEDPAAVQSALEAGARDCIHKLKREDLLQAVLSLAQPSLSGSPASLGRAGAP